MITTVATGGGVADFVTSGLSDEEVQTLVSWPDGSGSSSTCGTVAGRTVEPTATEYELLRALSQNAGRVLTYERLPRAVWGRRRPQPPG